VSGVFLSGASLTLQPAFRERNAFRANPNYSGGLNSWCRSCHAEAVQEWQVKNPDYFERYNAERRAEYREANPLTTRPCVVCEKPMARPANVLVCGEDCRRQRKLVQRRLLRLISKT
jgi:hypothetical protein